MNMICKSRNKKTVLRWEKKLFKTSILKSFFDWEKLLYLVFYKTILEKKIKIDVGKCELWIISYKL